KQTGEWADEPGAFPTGPKSTWHTRQIYPILDRRASRSVPGAAVLCSARRFAPPSAEIVGLDGPVKNALGCARRFAPLSTPARRAFSAGTGLCGIGRCTMRTRQNRCFS